MPKHSLLGDFNQQGLIVHHQWYRPRDSNTNVDIKLSVHIFLYIKNKQEPISRIIKWKTKKYHTKYISLDLHFFVSLYIRSWILGHRSNVHPPKGIRGILLRHNFSAVVHLPSQRHRRMGHGFRFLIQIHIQLKKKINK